MAFLKKTPAKKTAHQMNDRQEASADEDIVGAEAVTLALREYFPFGTAVLEIEHLQGPLREEMTNWVGTARVFVTVVTFGAMGGILGKYWAGCHSATIIHTARGALRLEFYPDGIHCIIGTNSRESLTLSPEEIVVEKLDARADAYGTVDAVIELTKHLKDKNYSATHFNCHHFADTVILLLDRKKRTPAQDHRGFLPESWFPSKEGGRNLCHALGQGLSH
jgi:hypothetical protein